ncbi:MAG: hypothetical protein KGL53_00185 [Elusimicrobia bacterium]|nr:hypothetical protein [Elusimicrobiota bacterium]
MQTTILGVPAGRFILAVVLLLMGLGLIGCGVEACWLRLGRRPRGSRR